MKKSNYLESLDSYGNLVNQPTFGDSVGEAFSAAGNQPATGAAQRSTNALMLGIGGGMKGAANEQRREQLSPMLQEAGRITAEAAKLEAQAQEAQKYQYAVQEFGQKYTPLVAEFANAVNANDPRATIIFRDLMKKASSIPGYENLEGESWDASKGYGLALNTETGEYRKITSDDIISAIAPSAQAIYGDKWFEKFLPLNAGVAKDAEYAFNTNRQATALELQGKEASVASKYAQADNQNMQTEMMQQQMNNPVNENDEKLNSKIKMDRAQKNYELVKSEIVPRLKANENVLSVYEAIKDIKENNPKIIGSDYLTQARRALATAFGGDPEIDYANLKSVEFEKMLKPILGAQLGEREGERVLSKFISLNQNPASIDRFLNEEIPKLTKEIVQDKERIDAYDNENYVNLFSNNINNNLDQKVQDYSNSRNKVKMIAPDGSIAEVEKKKVEYWKQEGARLFYE